MPMPMPMPATLVSRRTALRTDSPAELVGSRTRDTRYGEYDDPELEAAREEVAALIERRGWRIRPGGPATEALAGALTAMARVGHGDFATEVLDEYAWAAEQVAAAGLGYVGRKASREDLVETVVIGDRPRRGSLLRRLPPAACLYGPPGRLGPHVRQGGRRGPPQGRGRRRCRAGAPGLSDGETPGGQAPGVSR